MVEIGLFRRPRTQARVRPPSIVQLDGMNAHRTTERRLLYPWHPWSGLSVHVHEVTERDVTPRCGAASMGMLVDALRCRPGCSSQRPAWRVRLASQPQVGIGALFALRRLLAEVSGRRSWMPGLACGRETCPSQNRGEVDAMPPRPLPGEVGKPSSAIRSVRPARVASGPAGTVWPAMPEETRRSLTGLLARLLLEHEATRPRRAEVAMSADKIRPHHLARKAILYVRQSSAHQVLHNPESRALQYAMRDRLAALGWSEIEIVDDDLGRSAAGGVARAGFERMVAEVCLGKVGAVAAREVSRFARNSREWQQLIEMCRVVDTVLVDGEAVYAPRDGNDRLLLGLKGSLNLSIGIEI